MPVYDHIFFQMARCLAILNTPLDSEEMIELGECSQVKIHRIHLIKKKKMIFQVF